MAKKIDGPNNGAVAYFVNNFGGNQKLAENILDTVDGLTMGEVSDRLEGASPKNRLVVLTGLYCLAVNKASGKGDDVSPNTFQNHIIRDVVSRGWRSIRKGHEPTVTDKQIAVSLRELHNWLIPFGESRIVREV